MPPALPTAPQPDQRRAAPLIEPIAMRVPDACRFVGISRSTLYVLISRGEIEIVKLGCSTLILTESLKGLIAHRRRPVGGKAAGIEQ
ncbi:MAG: helix-turn-helix domain-containing protein [Alphaproteobacteria bacterium]|nr:helix-turn-helix domain-containing protein [Alphaproteobacteria bacterium]